ncbi:MAG: choice-of-anchor tandem repeat GloVer-containing protein [Terriglobales bacterium]
MHADNFVDTFKLPGRALIAALVFFALLASHPAQAKEIVIFNQTSSTANPISELVADSNGVLYGTASLGGPSEFGSVFSVNPPAEGQTAWTETVLYTFQGGTDGIAPNTPLIPDGQGGFYSTTLQGGTGPCPLLFGVPGCGTIFHLSPPAQGETDWTETIIYSFQGGNDGAFPGTLLRDPATGVFYGVTFIGGSYGAGIAFSLTPPSQGQTNWTETILHTFTGGSDGGYPYCTFHEDASGALYGTATTGGFLGSGDVYKLTPPTQGETNWNETVLYSFGGEGFGDAGNPSNNLLADASGNLYGIATTGGSGVVPVNVGAIFELSPPSGGGTTWTETIIYSFTGAKDGADPDNDLIMDGKGVIYGATDSAGIHENGTTFKLEPPAAGQTAWTFKLLWDFRGDPDGKNPAGGLTPVKLGKKWVLFGESLNGGTNDSDGDVYELTNTGYVP